MIPSTSCRRRLAFSLALGLAAIMAPALATTIPVTTIADTTSDDRACSLREAVAAANTDTASGASNGECPAGSGSDTITFADGIIVYELDATLVINSPVELAGNGDSGTIIDGLQHNSVILVLSGQVTLRGLTVRGGGADAPGGGGVRVDGGTVDILDARITGNRANSGGAGLFAGRAATVTLRRVTIDGNNANGAFGGGIWNKGTLRVYDSLIGGDPAGERKGNESDRTGGIRNDPGATLNLINTTVSGNFVHATSGAGVGGISNLGFAFLNNVTITNNTGAKNKPASFRGGGVQTSDPGILVVNNSIIAGNHGDAGAPNDCDGALSTDSAYDLIGDINGCELPPIERGPQPATFKLGVPVQLGDLLFNGGPTRTHLPAAISPVIDAGFPYTPGGPAAGACAATDQRGILRLYCDIGAVEREVEVPSELLVNTTNDEVDARPGNGICATANGTCSLRAAVQEANRVPGSQTIKLPAGLYTLTLPPGEEGGLDLDAGGDLDLQGSVVVAGADRATVIVDGNRLSRIFDVAPRGEAIIRGITVRNGNDLGGAGLRVTTAWLNVDNVIVEANESSGRGGGIEATGLDPVLSIDNAIVRNNRALGGDGGGIAANGFTTIHRTSITGNHASGAGGGAWGGGTLNVLQSTISGNQATGSVLANGGGISFTEMSLVESTVSGNSADAQGGGLSGGSGSIINSTISGNASSTRGGGVATSGNLVLLHATVAANQASQGGTGLLRFGSGSTLSLQNTILANPSGTECAGLAPSSSGNNIASDASCSLAAAGDRQSLDAQLDPLGDFGGPTRTHRPRDGSPAINAGATVNLERDQRGVPRPQGPAFDIGAVERRTR
jgi:CSLREA domain-containing protein